MYRPYHIPQHVNGDFHWFLRTRFCRVVAQVVIVALLLIDAPRHLLEEAFAQSATVFGPEDFGRRNGAPQTVTRSFSVSTPSGPFTLCLANGGQSSQYPRVSSAVVTLNNTQILRPNDFNQNVGQITRAVIVRTTNTLKVEVRSQLGSGFTLTIVRGNSCPSTGNRPPVARAGADKTVTVGATVQLDGRDSSDPDGNPLTYSWSIVSKPTTSTATLSNPTNARPTLRIDKAGQYLLQLIVNDGQVSSAPDQIMLSPHNVPPAANAGPDQSVGLTEVVQLDGSLSSDRDGDPLTYQWRFVSKPTGSTAALSSTSAVKPTFVVDKAGRYVAELRVSDGRTRQEHDDDCDGDDDDHDRREQPATSGHDDDDDDDNDGQCNRSVDRVVITTENSKPVANAGPDQSAARNTTVTLDGSSSTDVDGDRLTYQWTLTAPAGSSATLSSPTAVKPTFTLDLPGTYTAQLVVNDGRQASDPDTVVISTENTRPVADAGDDRTVALNSVVTLEGRDSSDVDGDPLTYRWTLLSKPTDSTATLTNATTATPRFTADKPGDYTVQLIVNDGTEDSVPDTVVISTLNSKPVADAGDDQTGTVNQLVTLDGSGSTDDDNDTLTYQWSFTSKPDNSTATLSTPTAQNPTFTPDQPGLYVAQLIIRDGKEDSDPDTVSITVNPVVVTNNPPQITSTPIPTATVNKAYSYDVDATDPDAGDTLTYSLTTNPTGMTIDSGTGRIAWTPAANQTGPQDVTVQVSDGHAGGTDTQSFTITVSNLVSVPDVVGQTQAAAQAALTGANLTVGTVTNAHSATVPTGRVISQDPPGGTSVAPGTAVSLVVSLGPSPEDPVPPDPSTVAPSRNIGSTTNLAKGTEFLYKGNNPIQTGVADGTIDVQRAAVIRGKVLDRTGAPLPAVRISVLNHPEFGQTRSRADGMFDLAVNGGGSLTVKYEKTGFFSAQRLVTVPWQDFVFAPDVVLTPPDPQSTVVNLQAPGAFQVARGRVVTDGEGARRATLFFPQGTVASFKMANGSTQQAPTSLTVRQTEYTEGSVAPGSTGPLAMPSELPATSGYTYYVELTADEAQAAGAVGVEFNQPVIFYLENFLAMEIGEFAPVGFYDRQAGKWIGSPNGQVIKIVGVTDSAADLDTNGDGAADQGVGTGFQGADLGITLAERQQLASLYATGQELWRVPTLHFSPGDINWPYGPPSDATGPNGDPPRNPEDEKPPCNKCPRCQAPGSIIECGNQILGESAPIVGTPFNLNYRSDRVPGRRAAYQTKIPVTGASVPASLKRVEIEVEVAGQQRKFTFPSTANQTMQFEWDGQDGYGRIVQGRQWANIRITFVYPAVFQRSARAFRQAWAVATGAVQGRSSPSRGETRLIRTYRVPIGAWDVRDTGVGGWTLDVHHGYDPLGKVLYLGTGERRTEAESLGPVITTVAGNGAAGSPADGSHAITQPLSPRNVAVTPDGMVLIYNTSDSRIYRLDPDTGIITPFAGNVSTGAPLDGASALQVRLGTLETGSLAAGPDGSLYVAGLERVRRIRPDGSLVETIAGTGVAGFSGDGGPATAAQLGRPVGIAVTADNSVFVMENDNNRIRRIDPDGIITTVVGTGVRTNPVLGPALQSPIRGNLDGLAAAPDGGVYFIAGHTAGLSSFARIYHIGRDGILRNLGGGGTLADGSSALSANLACGGFFYLAPTSDGQLLYANAGASGCDWVRLIDQTGRVRTFAGVFDQPGFTGDGGPATQAKLAQAGHLAVGADGNAYIVDSVNRRVRRVGSRFPSFAGLSDILISSEDGLAIYRFNPDGRHLDTRHSLTGAVLWSFTYDAAGRLTRVTDGDGNVTAIERNGSGLPTAIVGPFGQRTTLVANTNGYVTRVENPAAEVHQFGYTANGLLTSMTTPRNHNYTFAYEAATGYLQTDADPAGGSQTLARTDLSASATLRDGHEVSTTTGLGRVKRYRIEQLRTGARRETSIATDGTATTVLNNKDGSNSMTSATGMTSTATESADPRFGMLAPLTSQAQLRTPANRTRTTSEARSVTLTDPTDLLSLTQLTETLTLNGRTGTSVYTAATKQFADTSPAGRQGTTTIDTLGRPTASQFGGLAPSAYTYDARGRLAMMTMGTGAEARTWTFTYNAQSYVETITDSIGRVTRFTYDNAGRVLTQMLPDLRVITYTHDANGNLAALAPPGRPDHAFTYSPVDLETQYNPPNVPGVTPDDTGITYNIDRQVTAVARPDGKTITPTYDSAGRVSSLAFSRGAVGMTYSATTGLVTNVTAPAGVGHAFTYDGSLLTQHTLSGPVPGSVAWTYDNDFRAASQSVNGANTVNFTYDADSLLTQAGSLTLTRNLQNGLLTGTTLGVVTDSMTYNSHAEPADQRAQVSGGDIYRAQFTRDGLGRITRKVETLQGTTTTFDYSYDVAGRLREVKEDNSVVSTYLYDENSNRLSGPTGATTYSYDAQDRLTQYGATSFTYNQHGDLATKTEAAGVTTYTYDEFGNLTQVVLPGGATIDYVIDGMNRRVGKKVNGALVKRWLYDGQLRIVAELDGAGTLVSRFIYATKINVPEYMVQGANTFRIVTDYLGSPRLVINTATGAVVQQMNYNEFGNVLQDTNPGFMQFGFAGGLYDPDTGLVRFGARDYDSAIGRWTTKDPIGFGGGDANLYAYAAIDPVNMIDPDGLEGVRIRGVGPFGTVATQSPGSRQPINVIGERMVSSGTLIVRPEGKAEVRVYGNTRLWVGPGRYCIDDLIERAREEDRAREKLRGNVYPRPSFGERAFRRLLEQLPRGRYAPESGPAEPGPRPGIRDDGEFEIMTPNAIIGVQG